MWKANEHSLEENSKWSLLRGIEWLNLPIFLSQAIGPILLYLFPSFIVYIIICTLVINLLWQNTLMKIFVSVPIAYIGVLLVHLKWIICPVSAVLLWINNYHYTALVALFWPILIVILSYLLYPFEVMTIRKIGIGGMEKRFMTALGYKSKE